MTSRRRVAAFDFDGTLSRRDVLLPFLVRACGSRAVGAAVARVAPTATRARLGRLQADLHHRDATKVALLRELFAGRSAAWVADEGERFAASLERRLRPDVAGQLRWHRAEGHEVVLVSASLGVYLRPWAEAHGVDHVIAVELADDGAGRLTGELAAPNVRGPEKARRLAEWLGEEPPAHLWAYGNSSGDRELLAAADTPVWIGGYRPAA